MAETHPDVPIIFLPGNSEFEQLVPVATYFNALSLELSKGIDGTVLKEECEKWIKTDEKHSRRAFSKQIWGWLDDSYEDHTLTKPSVMRKAVELVKPDDINAQPLKDLLAAIRKHLQDTSF
jgi:hypothetical protein